MDEFMLREAAGFALSAFGAACVIWCARATIKAILYIMENVEVIPKDNKKREE